jgi:hypothetical protein
MPPQHLDWRRIPWRTLPWGKTVGAALGLTAGLFGMVFGLIVGHLVDEMLWSHVIRRLLRRYARTATAPPELAPLETPLAVLAVLTREATCDARSHAAAAAGMAAALSYLADRYGTSTRRRRTLTHATEEFHSVFAADDPGGSEAPGGSKPAGEAPAGGTAAPAGARDEAAAGRDDGPPAGGSRDAADSRGLGEAAGLPGGARLEEAFRALLQSLLAPRERAEVAWLAGRIARDAPPCARTAAEDLARQLGVSADIVADAARAQGKLDERACMLLGVPQDADKDQIRGAYRRLAAEFHPDATRDLEPHQRRQAEVAFIRIREAYEKLIREL